MKLRPATDSDRALLFELHREAFQDHIEKIWGWDENWQRANFAEEFTYAATSVIEIEDKIVGYVQTADEPNRIYVLNIAISQTFQGQGTGTQILRDLQRKATDRKVPIELAVFRTNALALILYKRLGFRQTGDTDTHTKMSWGY